MVGNESWKRYVLRRLQKTGSVEAEVTSCGKLFQSLLPATAKARSPIWSPAALVGQSVRPTMMNAGADGCFMKLFNSIPSAFRCFVVSSIVKRRIKTFL